MKKCEKEKQVLEVPLHPHPTPSSLNLLKVLSSLISPSLTIACSQHSILSGVFSILYRSFKSILFPFLSVNVKSHNFLHTWGSLK